MSNKLKIGDIVMVRTMEYLSGRESLNWALAGNLNLKDKYKVTGTSPHLIGWVEVNNGKLFHHPDRFVVVDPGPYPIINASQIGEPC